MPDRKKLESPGRRKFLSSLFGAAGAVSFGMGYNLTREESSKNKREIEMYEMWDRTSGELFMAHNILDKVSKNIDGKPRSLYTLVDKEVEECLYHIDRILSDEQLKREAQDFYREVLETRKSIENGRTRDPLSYRDEADELDKLARYALLMRDEYDPVVDDVNLPFVLGLGGSMLLAFLSLSQYEKSK